MKFYDEENTMLIRQLHGKIDFLHYVSELLIEIAKKSSSHDLRQLEYFLSMAAIESSDSLVHVQQQLDKISTMSVMDQAYRQ